MFRYVRTESGRVLRLGPPDDFIKELVDGKFVDPLRPVYGSEVENLVKSSPFSDKQQIRLFMLNSEKELKDGLNRIAGNHDFEDAKEESLKTILHGINTLCFRTGAQDVLAQCKKWEINKETGKEELCLMKSSEVSSIIKFNAIVCSLALFTWLSSEVKMIADPKAEEEWINNPVDYIKDIRNCKREEYFQTWMKFMTPPISGKPNQEKEITRECYIPIIFMMIVDRYIEEKDRSEEEKDQSKVDLTKKRINWLLNSWSRKLYSYLNNKNLRQLYHVNTTYVHFLNRIIKVIQASSNVQSQNGPIENTVTAFFSEMVFHIRALTCCEKDLDRHGITPSSQYDTNYWNATWPFVKLKLRTMMPMVFGIDDIDFSNICGINSFIELVQQTALLTYWYASADAGTGNGFLQICKTACELLRECLADQEFKSLIEESQKIPSYGAIGGKMPADRLVLVDECFGQYGFACNYGLTWCCDNDTQVANSHEPVYDNRNDDNESSYHIILVNDEEKKKFCHNSEELVRALEEHLTRYATIWYTVNTDWKAWSVQDPNCRYERNIKLLFRNELACQYYRRNPERLKNNNDLLSLALEPVLPLSEAEACYNIDLNNLHILFWDEENENIL